jgi:ADP-ribose pyrophosphatase
MKKVTEKTLFKGNWLSLQESTFENKAGDFISWESVTRKNNSSSVVIIPKLIPSQRFILIKQFRPAINGYILGLPAGINNDSDEAIIKELKEETGYTGIIKKKSPLIKSQSGILDDFGRVIYMHIDENNAVNINPIQELDSSEDIEVFLIHQDEIENFLFNSLKQGISIGANLWYLFVASKWIRND